MARGNAWVVIGGSSGNKIFYSGEQASEDARGLPNSSVRKFMNRQDALKYLEQQERTLEAPAMLRPQQQLVQRSSLLEDLGGNKLLSLKVDCRKLVMGQEGGRAVQEDTGACIDLHAEGLQPRLSMSFDKDTQELDLKLAF